MATRDLNERQQDVLHWIVDGCPDRAWPDDTYKLSAKALQSRRLVTVRRRRGVWSAEPTPAGIHFAKHGAYPDGHWPKTGTEQKAVAARDRSKPAASDPAASLDDPPKPHGRAAAEALVAEVRAAGGRLFVGGDRRAEARKAMYRANAIDGLLGPGERLVSQHSEIRLEQVVPQPEVPSIRVGARLPSKPHPVIAEMRARRVFSGWTKDASRRAYLVLQALAVTAAENGHGVAAHPKGGLLLTIDGQKIPVLINEPQNRSPRVLTKDEEQRKARGEYMFGPSYDYEPSGRLRIRVDYDEFTEPKPNASGRGGWRLEDRLDRVYAACLAEAAKQSERQRERETAAERRRQQYEIDKANARVAYVEMKRAEVLADQVDRWVRCGQIRGYIAALKERVAATDPGDVTSAGEWIAWAEAHAQDLDPLTEVPHMPEVRVPDDYDLARVMGLRDPAMGMRQDPAFLWGLQGGSTVEVGAHRPTVRPGFA